jgi:hypothetical protein
MLDVVEFSFALSHVLVRTPGFLSTILVKVEAFEQVKE